MLISDPANNRLEELRRRPSDLRAYLQWSHDTRLQYGNMVNYILQKKLFWTPITSTSESPVPLFACANPTPFADPADYQILLNDWPYGLALGIVHIVIWLKPRLNVVPETGDLTAEARELVRRFVGERFVNDLIQLYESSTGKAEQAEEELKAANDRVLWFKNWGKLQSVQGIDHVHVLVRDTPPELIEKWIRRG